MAIGQLGRAEVMNVQVTGASVQHGGAPPEQVCVFDLMVYLDDTPPFPAQTRKRVPVYALADIQPGQTVIAVRVDPNDHSRVGIDFSVDPPVIRLARTEGNITAQEVLERGSSCEAVIIQSQPLGVKSSVSGLDMYAFMLTIMAPGQAPLPDQGGQPGPARRCAAHLPWLEAPGQVPARCRP